MPSLVRQRTRSTPRRSFTSATKRGAVSCLARAHPRRLRMTCRCTSQGQVFANFQCFLTIPTLMYIVVTSPSPTLLASRARTTLPTQASPRTRESLPLPSTHPVNCVPSICLLNTRSPDSFFSLSFSSSQQSGNGSTSPLPRYKSFFSSSLYSFPPLHIIMCARI